MTIFRALIVICPIFALIGAGYLCGRRGFLGPTASSELNRFVVYLGLPALLFQIMSEADWPTLWQPGFIASFLIGSLVIFAGTLLWQAGRGRHLSDAAIDGLNAGYANAGYIGFPLCEPLFGRQGLALVTLSMLLTVCVLFAIAIVFVEIGAQAGAGRAGGVTAKVGRSLVRNPLVLAPVLGGLWASTGLHTPSPATSFLHLLGSAASPCALVSLGLFLAMPRPDSPRARSLSLALTALKLVGQPLVTALCAYAVFRIPAMPASVAVLMAALPTGTGPFMIAEYYRREALVTSRTVLLSTVLSVLTLALCISLIG